MYAGRMGYGAHLPTSLGDSAVYNLAEVPESGYGPYLGDFFDTLKGIADKVSQAAMAAGAIKSGDARVTVVPTQQGVVKYAEQRGITPTTIALVLGGGALLWFATRRSGRR